MSDDQDLEIGCCRMTDKTLSDGDAIPSAVHSDCRDFVAVVEELLKRRQIEAGQTIASYSSWKNDEWGPRTWVRTEFEDMVYGSYKPMRQGRVTRPPRREIVMDVADYLNCSLEERNRLLLAARATPVTPYLTGAKLEEALQAAIGVVQNLPLPAIIINRDWHIHYINQHTLTIIGVTPEDVIAIPPPKLNILHLLFDPVLPLYPHLIQNRESWTRMVRQTIFGFKMANLFCQFEPWYQALVRQLMELPEFEENWRTVRVDAAFESDPSAQKQPASVVVETVVSAGHHPKRVWLRPLLISVGYFQFDFPQIVAFLPADEESRLILRDIGIPVPGAFPSP
ncbi:MAG: hypothetical protein HY070_04465 [Chloroflexi bacterium]|nr:hypothetical protein [Chloroflexota bacterium]